MIRKSLKLFIWIFLLLSVSCSDDDNPISSRKIKGSGNPTTVVRSLPRFHSVNMLAVGDVIVSSGTEQSISITVDDNIVGYIETEVSDGELVIVKSDNVDLEDYDLSIHLTMTELRHLALGGVGSITSQNELQVTDVSLDLGGVGSMSLALDAGYIISSLSGVGNVSLTGSVRKHRCNHSAVGSLDAFGLRSDTTIATLSGVGNAQIYVDSLLDVTIAGIGFLYYKGRPEIIQTITGLGQVIDANPPDTIPPVVMSTHPRNGASDVDIGTDISVTFSEAIDTASIDTTTFRVGMGTASGTFSFDGNTVTFDPTLAFNSYVLISVTLTTGIKDLSGNLMLSDYSWSFDTGPEAP